MSLSANAFDQSFCEHCGAVLPEQAVTCPVCGEVQGRVHALLPQQSAASKQSVVNIQKRAMPGTLLMQRYRIIEQIGEGGFGVVYKAQDRRQGRLVAIKQITLADLSTREIIDATDSYNRETTILPRLSHRNLPVLYDHFTDPEHWYIVMEYIEGQTLEEILSKSRDGRLPLKKVVEIGRELCHALAYLHSQQVPIVFRDVKPGNIMINRVGKVYLIDFGIARRYRPEKKRDTGALGSPGYAAPEQYGSEQSTPRTDLYGLGATLQTMLTGKEPTEGADIEAEVGVPGRLKGLIMSLLEKEVRRRPENITYVESELDEIKKEIEAEKKKNFVSPYGWLAALWCLSFPFLKSLVFHTPITFIGFWLLPVIVIFSTIVHIGQARDKMGRPLSRKEQLHIVNQQWTNLGGSFTYLFYWSILSGQMSSGSFPENILFLLFYAVMILFIIRYLHKVIQWIQSIVMKQRGQQVVETEPLQQMSQRP